MPVLVLIAIAGLVAQLIDGSLGMAYGVTSTSLLLTFGVSPAAASASVHIAELATTAASATAHARFRNVDWRVVVALAVPGAVGAFAGAVVLSSLSTEVAAPVMSVILLGVGIYVLLRFARGPREAERSSKVLPARFLSPLGLVGGFLDASGGGGWGPVSTPTLLASGRLEPRKVVGSVDTAEFLVALGASAGFLIALDSSDLVGSWIVALVVGGVLAAPFAAWLVQKLPPRVLGVAVGGMVTITNVRALLSVAGIQDTALSVAFALGAAAWLSAMVAWWIRDRDATPQPG